MRSTTASHASGTITAVETSTVMSSAASVTRPPLRRSSQAYAGQLT